MPPMRPRAGTTLMLSTVANTAFSSATDRGATVSVWAQTTGMLTISAAKAAIAVNPRIGVLAIMNSLTACGTRRFILSTFRARSLTCLKTLQLTPA